MVQNQRKIQAPRYKDLNNNYYLETTIFNNDKNNNDSGSEAAAGHQRRPLVVAGLGQGNAGKVGPGQTKPRLGTSGKPAKPKQFCASS